MPPPLEKLTHMSLLLRQKSQERQRKDKKLKTRKNNSIKLTKTKLA
jgi:hypothetical protein